MAPDIVTAEPSVLPMFPLSTVVFPGGLLPLHVFEERYRALVADVLDAGLEFGTVLITAGSEVGGGDRRSSLGTRLRIEAAEPVEDGRWLLVTRAVERIEVVEWLADDPYPRALVRPAPSLAAEGIADQLERTAAALRRLRMLLSELDSGPGCGIDFELDEDPAQASWTACALAPIGQLDAQSLLEESDPSRRLDGLLERCCERIADIERLLRSSEGG